MKFHRGTRLEHLSRMEDARLYHIGRDVEDMKREVKPKYLYLQDLQVKDQTNEIASLRS